MNRNHPVLRFYFSFSSIPFLISAAICVFLLISLSSCNTGSKGRYKFQSESMHWLQFRGPNASGIAPEDANPPVYFSADTNLLWKTEVLPGWSSPCIVNDKVFLTGFDDSDSLLYTVAINRENGANLWKDSVQPNNYYDLHAINSYANPTIASDGERIFNSFPNYGLIAYDLDGNKIWDFQYEVLSNFYGGSYSPVILDSTVLIFVDSDLDPKMMALNNQTGDSVWTIRATENDWASLYSRATPVVWNDLLILHLSKAIVAFNLTDRSAEWWLSAPTSGVGTPVIMGNMLFMNAYIQLGEENVRGENISFAELLKQCDKNGNGSIEQDEFSEDMILFQRPEIPEAPRSAIHLNDDIVFEWFDENKNQSFEEGEWNDLWEYMAYYMEDHGMMAIALEGSGERPVTDIIWKVNEDTPETPSPLVVHENVVFIKNGGIMTVINQESGEVVHKDRLGAAGGYLSSPMLAGNRIYTCSYNGTVTVLSADDFTVLANNRLKEKIGASPVAVDDVLYVRTDKHLYAFRDQ